jgi:hypothetical protein
LDDIVGRGDSGLIAHEQAHDRQRVDVAMDSLVVAPQPASQNANGRSWLATHLAQKL